LRPLKPVGKNQILANTFSPGEEKGEVIRHRGGGEKKTDAKKLNEKEQNLPLLHERGSPKKGKKGLENGSHPKMA